MGKIIKKEGISIFFWDMFELLSTNLFSLHGYF
jgi:hypothetical protein